MTFVILDRIFVDRWSFAFEALDAMRLLAVIFTLAPLEYSHHLDLCNDFREMDIIFCKVLRNCLDIRR